MNRAVLSLTARQLLGQRRTLLMVGAAALPLVIAILYRISSNDTNQPEFTARGLLGQLVIGTLLPLAALIFGTAALGSEIEDGTAVYLLSKPIPRWSILLSKLLVAWLATSVLVVVATVAAGTVAMSGAPQDGIVLGFAVAAVVGAFLYCALFVYLTVLTGRALIVGLVYVFIWEGVITRLFSGVRVVSIRQYSLGVADAFVTAPKNIFNPLLDPAEAFALVAATSAIVVVLAIQRLRVWEIGESG
jgi:ABC-2 type transport system permease protein